MLEKVRWLWRSKLNGDVSSSPLLFPPFTDTRAKAHGLWGQAKFQEIESAPFASLVRTLWHHLGYLTSVPRLARMPVFGTETADRLPYRSPPVCDGSSCPAWTTAPKRPTAV